MANPVNVGKDGVIFVNCLKPAGHLLYKFKHAPPHVKAATYVAAGAVALGGIGYYIWRKASRS